MALISTKDFVQVSGLKKLGFFGKPLAWTLMKILRIDEINALYKRNKDATDPYTFLKRILDDQGIRYELHEEDLKRIPKEGPFIITSNHPLGGWDGILMMKIISDIRPDFKIMGNFLLQRIEPLAPMVIPVNPFEQRKEIKSSLQGMKDAMLHVREGHCLGIFPAGEVSNKNESNEITDKKWMDAAMKLVKKADVPVIPMYFHAKNSNIFYRLAKINPNLQTAMLPSEMMRSRIKPIKIRIGKPILAKQQKELENLDDYTAFLRNKTYMLKSFYDQKQLLQVKIPRRKAKPEVIIDKTPLKKILSEVEALRNDENRLFANNNYTCFFCSAKEIPNILREIGRLREIAFRNIGEGTNKSIDLDKYDKIYRHLFLWDEDKQVIVGAYRMALGKEIFDKYGSEGFYINELFDFEPEIIPFFKKCIEMGRAFVHLDYQQKPMPLFLLWRGIVHITLRHPELKYIIGGVSISNQFSNFSKSMMIEFMKSHYYDPFVAQYIRPRKEFKPKLKDAEKEFIFDEAQADLNKFDKLIDEIEPNALRLPVLIKKYIKQNAKVIGFNVDPKFNDAIDGLMYIRISDLPEDTVQPVIEELQKELEKRMEK